MSRTRIAEVVVAAAAAEDGDAAAAVVVVAAAAGGDDDDVDDLRNANSVRMDWAETPNLMQSLTMMSQSWNSFH